MFSPFENAEVEDYFNRLNAQLRKMPAEGRREMHQELRQHLDALVAAHEELGASPGEALRAALDQLGEPKRIGRRLLHEWRATQARKRKPTQTVITIIFGIAAMETGLMYWYCWGNLGDIFGSILPGWLFWPLFYTIPMAIGGWAGLVSDRSAVKSVFHGSLPMLGTLAVESVHEYQQFKSGTGFRADLVGFAVIWLLWLGLSELTAHAVGVLRFRVRSGRKAMSRRTKLCP